MNVAFEYGRLLGANPMALRKLTRGYPENGFVVDFDEIKKEKLFSTVRRPTEIEEALAAHLTKAVIERWEENLLREPSDDKILGFLLNPVNQPIPPNDNANQGSEKPTNGNQSDTPPIPPDHVTTSAVSTILGTEPQVPKRDGENNGGEADAGRLSVKAADRT
jgi:hypothetical protein